MPTFLKTKDAKMRDIKKRFQFEPQLKGQTNRLVAPRQKTSEIIIRDQNEDFSSVKERNDFNDSSWLAKLVNGIQEIQPHSIKPLSQISQINEITSENGNMKSQDQTSGYTITRKSSQQLHQKAQRRKSVPVISGVGNQRFKYMYKENAKANFKSNGFQNQTSKEEKQTKFKYQKWSSNDNGKVNNQKKKANKQGTDLRHKLSREEENHNHKNSLINYSSIQEEEGNFQVETHQKIIIDLDEISLKTQKSRQTTPVQKKQKFQYISMLKKVEQKDSNEESLFKQRLYTSNRLKTDLSNGDIKIKVKEGQNEKKVQKTEQTTNKKDKHNSKVQNIPPVQTLQVISAEKQIQPENLEIIQNNKLQSLSKQDQAKKPFDIDSNNITVLDRKQSQNPNSNNQNQFSSKNQFLDTFKHQQVLNDILPRRGGIIKKNVTHKDKPVINKLNMGDCYGFYSQETRIPTFSERPTDSNETVKVEQRNQRVQNPLSKSLRYSPMKVPSFIKKQNIEEKSVSTIKKGEISTLRSSFDHQNEVKNRGYRMDFDSIRQKQKIAQQTEKQSPKFRYEQINKISKQKYSKTTRTSEVNFKQIFNKLNINQEEKIHKNNCYDVILNEEQKYEIGSIISKIKYLDRVFTQKQFISQCFKLNNQPQTHEEFSYHTFQPNLKDSNDSLDFRSCYKVPAKSKQDRVVKQGENFNKGNLMTLKSSYGKIKNSDKVNSHLQIATDKQREKNEDQFLPLFSEIQNIKTQNLAPSRSAYLQMPTLCSQSQIMQNDMKQQGGDLGIIIDNLNSKLTNYIQTNHLEDTYRKFKLQFVHLRKNMQY